MQELLSYDIILRHESINNLPTAVYYQGQCNPPHHHVQWGQDLVQYPNVFPAVSYCQRFTQLGMHAFVTLSRTGSEHTGQSDQI